MSKYGNRLVFFNLLIFVLVMLLVIFISLQSAWYFSVNESKNILLQTATDINLLINEKTASLQSSEEEASYFSSNAQNIYNQIQDFSNSSVVLFNYSGEVLAYNLGDDLPSKMNIEYQQSVLDNATVMNIKNFNGNKELWLLSPIHSKSQNTIGFVGLTTPLTSAVNLQYFSFFVLGSCLFLGFIMMAIFITIFSKNFIKPIKNLTTLSNNINKGDYDKTIKYKKQDEIGDLTQVYNEMTNSINSVISQLRDERDKLGNVLAAIDDGLLALNDEGTIITSNHYIKTYFEVNNPKTIYDFKYYSFLTDIFDALKAGKTNVTEEVEVSGRILLLAGSPILSSEGALENTYLIIVRNVTLARTLESEQRKFISSVSHEIRTPLTTIIGYTDMLQRRKVDDPDLLSNSLATINREGHRLVRLVDDLLNANSLEKMTFSFHMEKIDLVVLLKNVVEQMRIKCQSKEIEIFYKAEENLPNINGDYDRLSQVFINIIHNAFKFSYPGGIIEVVLTLDKEDFLSVSIRDYGIGIDPAKKDYIFSAFYRTDEDRARNDGEGGAGLGLYLVKQVVEKHNGSISVESKVDEGTNITIKLPIYNDLNLDEIYEITS